MARHVDHVIAWVVEVRGQRFALTTFNGLLLDNAALNRSRIRIASHTSMRGRARQIVLSYCDGKRTVAEVEALVLKAHPDLFPSAQATESICAPCCLGYRRMIRYSVEPARGPAGLSSTSRFIATRSTTAPCGPSSTAPKAATSCASRVSRISRYRSTARVVVAYPAPGTTMRRSSTCISTSWSRSR